LLAETLFADLRRQYDYIIVDAPSFPLLPDAVLLSTYADLVLSVARPGTTRRDATDEHVKRIGALVPCGLVINDVDVATCERHGYAAGIRAPSRTPGRFRSAQRVSNTGVE
jgi:Mrp family chromosome partitioning ATPase